jgi:hypothetical protein
MEDTDMKKIYLKPVMNVVKIGQTQMICGSPDVINPGTPNKPAGARSSSGYDWDEE